MGRQAFEAGPRLMPRLREGQEAAGPACPRLLIEEVSFRLRPDGLGAQVTLALGPHRFTGHEAGQGQDNWQLAAAAAVKAVQDYLQHCDTALPIAQVRLLSAAATTAPFAQEAVHVIVAFRRGDYSTHLLGSALVRNDRCSTAVAAALDATSRQVSAYHLSSLAAPAAPAVAEPISRPPRRPAASAAGTRPLVLGLAINPAAVCAVAVDPDGGIVAQVRRPAELALPEAAVGAAVATAREAIAQTNSHASLLGAVGVAAPGAVRTEEGVCGASRTFPQWQDLQLAAPLADALNLPVELVGAVPAAALAEVEFGAAKGLSEVLYLRVTSDIEAALIAGGLPASTMGDVSHLGTDPHGPRCECGGTGCWRAVAGTDTLVARVAEAVGNGAQSALASPRRAPKLTPEVVCWAAAAGDPVAKAAVSETSRGLADGLVNLVTMLNPEAVILESDSTTVGAALRRGVEAAIKTSVRASAFSRCVLLAPDLDDTGPALGAAAWVARRLRDL
jgi:glucokinase